MDLQFTAEDRAFRERVRAWLREHMPRRRLETFEERRAWHRTLYDAGYVGMGWPSEYGGHPARPMEQAIVAEELARAGAPGPVNYMGLATAGPTILHHGTEEQKQRFLRPILRADEIWCQLFSEPNAGSDLASLQCHAEILGDEFIVNGQKIWTSSGTIAQWGLLLARTDRAAPKHQGISAMLVDMTTPGIEVRPLRQLNGSNEFSEVFFTNVRVPADNLVGELNAGWIVAQTPLAYERGGDTLVLIARLEQQFAKLREGVASLKVDGQRAIDAPMVRQKMGEILADIAVLRIAQLRILSRLEKGQHPGPEAAISKLHYTEVDKKIQELFLDILGPYAQQRTGVPDAFRLELSSEEELADWVHIFGYSRAGTIYAGSSEIQKNIIGERILGLPKEVRADRLQALARATG